MPALISHPSAQKLPRSFVITRRSQTAEEKEHAFITKGPHFLEQYHAGGTHITSTINL
jgi:hypothetical protein